MRTKSHREPVEHAAGGVMQPLRETRARRRRQTVLLIDDDDAFLGIVVPAVESRGHRVLVARTGAEADELVARVGIDFILVDGLLPDIDGIRWIEAFRKRDRATPIVFVSAFWGFVESLHRLTHRLGVELVVHKPVRVALLVEQIDRYAADSSGIRPVQLGPHFDDQQTLATARDEYARSLPAKLQDLSRAVADARANPGEPFVEGEARMRAHKLHGTAGCYGFQEIGEAAGAIEEALVETRDAGRRAAAWSAIDRALADVSGSAERIVRDASSRRGMPIGVGGARLLVVHDGPLFLAGLHEVAQSQLFEIVVASPANACSKALALPPDAAMIQFDDGDAADRSFSLARQLRALPGCAALPIAFVCASAQDRIESRIAAAKARATMYLTQPIDGDVLGLAVRQLFALHDTGPARVLIVGGEHRELERTAHVLERWGIAAARCCGPRRFLEALQETRPDLVVLEVGAGFPSGIELCRVLRTSPEWQDVPTLLVSDRADPDERLAALRAGVDDYLVWPYADDELVAIVTRRLSRMRLMRERFDKDALTGLPLRRPVLERLARTMAESQRHNRPLTVALLDVDLFKAINDREGHAMGDRVLIALGRLLCSRFRAEDLRGRWGGEEFLLVFPGQSSAVMSGLVTQVLGEFAAFSFEGGGGQRFNVTFSVGMASYPSDGASAHALLEVADRRLYEAKRAGRARVVSSG